MKKHNLFCINIVSLLIGFILCFFLSWQSVHAEIDYSLARARLIDEIKKDVHDTSLYLNKRELDYRVLQVMAKIPRHEYVPSDQQPYAYENRPLPIGYGQTISQPYIVAIMTDLIQASPSDRVLEIGTGSGYQAAILAELVERVFTMEIIKPLGSMAQSRLARLGYTNIQVSIADGYYGWAEHAPYDAIVVTAASSHIPPSLVRQLKPGGRMIIPVGSRFMVQQLVLVEKKSDSSITTRQILPVIFVPLTGGH